MDSQFELDFTLIACMERIMMVSIWYLDNGASFHMKRNKEIFSDLEEKHIQMHTEMADEGRYSVTGICIVTI